MPMNSQSSIPDLQSFEVRERLIDLANLFGHPLGVVRGTRLPQPEIGGQAGDWGGLALFVAKQLTALAAEARAADRLTRALAPTSRD